jgi:pyruvate ferredoxin oxidoreductase beta subunit
VSSSSTRFAKIKDLPKEHLLGAGTPLCAGCGGLEALHQIVDVMGERCVMVNAAGCMTLLSVYPFTPVGGSWLYTAMASAPAGAQGVRDALDILKAKGTIGEDDDLGVVTLTGDGSAYGMGMSATSAALERGLDFLYVVYDNEGYGNTGQQASAATPQGAKTSTSVHGWRGNKKDLFEIWVAHRPAYAATVIGAEPLDLARKVERALQREGPKLILALAPCPTGWDYDPSETVAIGRLAVQTGIWPLKEWADGELIHTKKPKKRLPVEAYLEKQGRFRHLFEPERDEATLGAIQTRVDAYWARVEGR